MEQGIDTCGALALALSIDLNYLIYDMRKRSFVVALLAAVWPAAVNAQVPVATYHYDTMRTGWNSHETTLSAASFPSNFGVLATLTFDDQIDAQPLIVPALISPGVWHDIIYVVTESNTVYAIDSTSRTTLVKRNLGPGWLLGWDASNPTALTPLAANQLSNANTTDPGVTPPFFLASIWMSGYGIAGTGTDLFFAIGNSDCSFSSRSSAPIHRPMTAYTIFRREWSGWNSKIKRHPKLWAFSLRRMCLTLIEQMAILDQAE